MTFVINITYLCYYLYTIIKTESKHELNVSHFNHHQFFIYLKKILSDIIAILCKLSSFILGLYKRKKFLNPTLFDNTSIKACMMAI